MIQRIYNTIATFLLKLLGADRVRKVTSKSTGKTNSVLIIVSALFVLSSCEKEPTPNNQLPDAQTQKVWIANEGPFNFGSASLSIYTPDSQQVFNDVYTTANNKSLGDVAQSIAFTDSNAFIVVNNSGKIVALNKTTFKETGVISIPQSSPRYMHIVNENLAFVTELYAKKIWIINPTSKTVIDNITTTGWTERIAASGNDLFIAQRTRLNDTYVANIIVVNTTTKNITNTISLPTEPNSLAYHNGKVWVMCSADDSTGENASLIKINVSTKTIEQTLEFTSGQKPGLLCLDNKNNRLLWNNGGIYQMPLESNILPSTAIIPGGGKTIYTLAADPNNGDIYFADALDYIQASTIYRHSSNGSLIHSFKAGLISGFIGFE